MGTASEPRRGGVAHGVPGLRKDHTRTGLGATICGCGARCRRADGDVIRAGLSADLDFSRAGRSENARRIAEVAVLLADAGIVAIVALVSRYAADRQRARLRAVGHDPPIPFLEVYVDAPPEVREARDVRGLYTRARAREIANFTGLTGDYEPPTNPDAHLHTDRKTPEECVDVVIALLHPGARSVSGNPRP